MSEADAKSKILKSSSGVAVATLFSRILGLVRVRLEAVMLGGGEIASGWLLAFAIPNLLRRLLGEGALGYALMPLVAEGEQQGGKERVRRELAVVFPVLALILAVIVIVVGGGAWYLGRHADSLPFPLLRTPRFQWFFLLLPILMPYGFFICLTGVVGAVLNYARVFFLPALGALLLNVFLISGLAGWWYFRGCGSAEDVPALFRMLGGSVLAAGCIQLLLMLILLKLVGFFPKFSWRAFRDCSILPKLWKLALPGLIGGAALQVSFLVDRFLGMWLGPQAVPALSYVDRIVDVPIGIYAMSLGTVLMAGMARSVAAGDQAKLAEDLHFWLRQVFFFCLPMAAMVVFFHEPMIRMLCLGGRYSHSDLGAARMVAVFYGVGIPAFCSLKVIVPMFHSRKRMVPPLIASLCAIGTNIILNLILMWPLAQGGIALATVLSSCVNNGILLWLLRKEGFVPDPRGLFAAGLRNALIAFGWGGVLGTIYSVFVPEVGWGGNCLILILFSACYGIGYLAISRLFRSPELADFRGLLRRRR